MLETDRLPPLFYSDNLHFAAADRVLLKNISLELPQAKLTVLIGANGAGKSTLMRLMTGFLTPTQGDCFLHGKPLKSYRSETLAQYRAVMKQHSQFQFPFLAEEVIKMGGYHRRHSEVERYFDEVVAATDCQTLCKKAYQQLSGGEQQRVQLARALLQIWSEEMHGKLLFLDEPTSAFDLYHQQQCLRLLSHLTQTRGLTVCAILHDLNLAALYGDQIILLSQQQIQAQGSPTDVLTEAQIRHCYGADISVTPHHQKNIPQVAFNY